MIDLPHTGEASEFGPSVVTKITGFLSLPALAIDLIGLFLPIALSVVAVAVLVEWVYKVYQQTNSASWIRRVSCGSCSCYVVIFHLLQDLVLLQGLFPPHSLFSLSSSGLPSKRMRRQAK
ncbi:hypothetical protein P692DRAFT_20274890 [Suillus brevipes Sb2]|nr:hypothetical protein P692DRAFT_20274890 [Suillus brevipes Sb2]